VVIRIAIWLQFYFDSTMVKNEHVHFFAESRGIIANKQALQGSGQGIPWRNSLRHGNTNGIRADRGGSVN